jgi:hypothetical protein
MSTIAHDTAAVQAGGGLREWRKGDAHSGETHFRRRTRRIVNPAPRRAERSRLVRRATSGVSRPVTPSVVFFEHGRVRCRAAGEPGPPASVKSLQVPENASVARELELIQIVLAGPSRIFARVSNCSGFCGDDERCVHRRPGLVALVARGIHPAISSARATRRNACVDLRGFYWLTGRRRSLGNPAYPIRR